MKLPSLNVTPYKYNTNLIFFLDIFDLIFIEYNYFWPAII